MTRGEQAIFNLEINKKRRSSNDIDIQHSKVFSSVKVAILLSLEKKIKPTQKQCFNKCLEINNFKYL